MHPPGDDLQFSNTTGILQKKTMWFIGVEVEQGTSAPPPKKNPRSAPACERGDKCLYGADRFLTFNPMKLIVSWEKNVTATKRKALK